MKSNRICAISTLLLPSLINATDLGVSGRTWPVAEKDAIRETEEKIASVDWKKILDPEKFQEKLDRYKPDDLVKLQRSKSNRTWYWTPSHTLEFNIRDASGTVMYPKGYTFNPLTLMPTNPRVWVFIDGNDKKQVEWFAQSGYRNRVDVDLILTDGGYYRFMKAWRRPVYYGRRYYVEKIGLQNLPAVVRQQGNRMEITEYDVHK